MYKLSALTCAFDKKGQLLNYKSETNTFKTFALLIGLGMCHQSGTEAWDVNTLIHTHLFLIGGAQPRVKNINSNNNKNNNFHLYSKRNTYEMPMELL